MNSLNLHIHCDIIAFLNPLAQVRLLSLSKNHKEHLLQREDCCYYYTLILSREVKFPEVLSHLIQTVSREMNWKQLYELDVIKTREFHNNSDDQFPLHFFDKVTYVPNGGVEGLELYTSDPFENNFTVEQVSQHLTHCLRNEPTQKIYNRSQLKEYSATEMFSLFYTYCHPDGSPMGMYPMHRNYQEDSIPDLIQSFATLIGYTIAEDPSITTLEDAQLFFEQTLLPYALEHECRFFTEFDQYQLQNSTSLYIGDFCNHFYMSVRDNHIVTIIGLYDYD